jgi:Ring finger domain
MATPSRGRPRSVDDEEIVTVEAFSPKLLFAPEQPLFTPVSTQDDDDEEEEEHAIDESRTDSSNPSDSEQSRLQREREEEESLELARLLMAEEAMASYQHHFQLLRESAHELGQEEYEALHAALEADVQAEVASLEDDDGDLSYDTMLELGERIGDVKSERWALVAAKEVDKLPTFTFELPSTLAANRDEPCTEQEMELKCMVCQCEFEAKEELRRLPCAHYFHIACVDQWLKDKDSCPYCRQCIVKRE